MPERKAAPGLFMAQCCEPVSLRHQEVSLLLIAWKVVNSLWLAPKKLEKCLREQGFVGNPYRFLVGDLLDLAKVWEEARLKPIKLSDDIGPRALPMEHQTFRRYGKNSFYWFGTTPKITIMDPELIREILNKYEVFQKEKARTDLLVLGLVFCEGERWAKHRRILNPAFHIEKLKIMVPAMQFSCELMAQKWEEMLTNQEHVDIDVWPFLDHLAGDMISRAAFGSSYNEGLEISRIQKEQFALMLAFYRSKQYQIPGWRFLPTKSSRMMKKNYKTVRALVMNIIEQRKSNKESKPDLLGILLESNAKEVEESKGSGISKGMSIDDVVEEVKLFYMAGEEAISSFLAWTMILLSQHQEWQQRARDEVFQVFGTAAPDFDGMSRLKTVTMIMNEVLRLYPPPGILFRSVSEPIKLKDICLLPGMTLYLPLALVHRDPELWGDDANEFKPERFSEGASGTQRTPGSFFAFGGGARSCIGQNFALLEAKMALAIILRQFSFELSPTYTHAPALTMVLYPQFGANLILRKIQS